MCAQGGTHESGLAQEDYSCDRASTKAEVAIGVVDSVVVVVFAVPFIVRLRRWRGPRGALLQQVAFWRIVTAADAGCMGDSLSKLGDRMGLRIRRHMGQ